MNDKINMLVPMVIEQTANGERSFDIYSSFVLTYVISWTDMGLSWIVFDCILIILSSTDFIPQPLLAWTRCRFFHILQLHYPILAWLHRLQYRAKHCLPYTGDPMLCLLIQKLRQSILILLTKISYAMFV